MRTEDLDIKAVVTTEPPQEHHNALALKMRLNKIKNKAKSYKAMHPNDASLRAVIDMAIHTEDKVAAELKKLDEAIERIKKNAPIDPKTKTRVEYLEYQKWYIQQHAIRAALEADRRRKILYRLESDPELQVKEMNKVRKDIEYWFDHYAWIVDPRNSVVFAFPFELFQFQREALKWINDLIYVERNDALIDKSRDMGVTWLIVSMFIYYWLFPQPGTQFHALITSYREDEVDRLGVPGTIFEKLRQQIRLLPSWMLPKGFDPEKHMAHMRIINPENGSSITGTTANAETGRSGRYTAIFFDEFASIKDDESSAGAAAKSTNTRIFVSTPKGKLNYFADLRFSGKLPVRSFHWTNHPFMDDRWYEGQRLKMSDEMVAQELDIDYAASQPGRVYQFNDVYHVITKSEFMREIHNATTIQEDGSRRFKIPNDWWLGRSHDWGSSDSSGEHANVTYWFARAKEGTRTRTHNIDISGAVFVYRELLMPPHSTVRQVARQVHKLQNPDREQERMQVELMSHEALSERDTYEQEHSLYYKAWDTDYNGGIAMVRDYLEIQYLHQPHPFRNSKEFEEKQLPVIKGRPMIYFVVDDDQGAVYFDQYTNKFQSRPAKDAGGLARIRAEIGVYHYPKTEAGKQVRKQRPEKMFDDAMDCLRCMAVTFPPVAQYTLFEQIEMELPKNLRQVELQNASPEEKAMLWLTRQSYLTEQKIKQRILTGQRGMTRRNYIMTKAKESAR